MNAPEASASTTLSTIRRSRKKSPSAARASKAWVITMGTESGTRTPTSRATPPVRSSTWPCPASRACTKAGSVAEGCSSSARPACWLRAMKAASLSRCTMLTAPSPAVWLAIVSDSAIGSSQITTVPVTPPSRSRSVQVVRTDQRPSPARNSGLPNRTGAAASYGAVSSAAGWAATVAQPSRPLVHSSRSCR